jgi:hypothetical protein
MAHSLLSTETTKKLTLDTSRKSLGRIDKIQLGVYGLAISTNVSNKTKHKKFWRQRFPFYRFFPDSNYSSFIKDCDF